MPIINYNKSFKDALKVMNQKKLGFVVIVKKKYIKGVITDGDLRRELKRFNNRENLNKYMSKSPYTVNINMPASKALAIMNEKKITALLVVSDNDLHKKNKRLVGIIHIHSLLQNGIRWFLRKIK